MPPLGVGLTPCTTKVISAGRVKGESLALLSILGRLVCVLSVLLPGPLPSSHLPSSSNHPAPQGWGREGGRGGRDDGVGGVGEREGGVPARGKYPFQLAIGRMPGIGNRPSVLSPRASPLPWGAEVSSLSGSWGPMGPVPPVTYISVKLLP